MSNLRTKEGRNTLYVKSKMKLFIKQKKTYRHRKLTWGYQRGMRGGIN